jgi:hypothetical protein
VFKTEKFPASVTDLDTGLSDVNGDDFAHIEVGKFSWLLKGVAEIF